MEAQQQTTVAIIEYKDVSRNEAAAAATAAAFSQRGELCPAKLKTKEQ